MSTLRRLSVTAVAVLSVGVVSGCGVGADVTAPGTAAQVGDSRVSVSELTDAATDTCEVFRSIAASAGEGQTFEPRVAGDVRREALEMLVLGEITDGLAEQEGVAASGGGLERQARDGLESELAGTGVDSDEAQGTVDRLTTPYRYIDVLLAIGQRELGIEDTEEVSEETLAAGLAVAQEWLAEQDTEVGARFGSEVALLPIQPAAQLPPVIELGAVAETSVPVSDQALSGSDSASLPAAQRCG